MKDGMTNVTPAKTFTAQILLMLTIIRTYYQRLQINKMAVHRMTFSPFLPIQYLGHNLINGNGVDCDAAD